jgi:hypothetical protein
MIINNSAGLCAPPGSDLKWVLLYEDRDKGPVLYTNGEEAYKAFTRAESANWRCHLLSTARRRITPSIPGPIGHKVYIIECYSPLIGKNVRHAVTSSFFRNCWIAREMRKTYGSQMDIGNIEFRSKVDGVNVDVISAEGMALIPEFGRSSHSRWFYPESSNGDIESHEFMTLLAVDWYDEEDLNLSKDGKPL